MRAIITGFLSGAAAGIIMGIVSHVLHKFRIFTSSLIVVDGSFFFRTLGIQARPGMVAVTGLVIHLVTSGVFGAIYFIATAVIGIAPQEAASSYLLIGLYIGILWLSMLFIALPIAGEGILGRRSGRHSWFEQLMLHIIFFIFYMIIVRLSVIGTP